MIQGQHGRKAPDAAVMDGEEGRESERGAAEEQEKTENSKVTNVKKTKKNLSLWFYASVKNP